MPSAQMAGMMAAAILSDTVMFKSPTCTERDIRTAERMARIANVSLDELVHGNASTTPVQPGDPDNPLPEGSYFDHKAREEAHAREMQRHSFPYPVLVAIAYIILGACFNLWHPGWLLFLTIPLYYLPASHRSPLKLLGNPVMVTIIYLLLGFWCNLWHPGWVVFLLIPVLNAVQFK